MELAILIGLQASGKSTFCARHLSGRVVVSKDHFPNARRREARQRRLIDEALAEGRDCVVDNTNPSADEWAPLIAIGRRHGATIIGYWFPPDVALSLERNAGRKRVVPEAGVFATLGRLRKPGEGDGFDLVYSVRADGNGGFVIEEERP